MKHVLRKAIVTFGAVGMLGCGVGEQNEAESSAVPEGAEVEVGTRQQTFLLCYGRVVNAVSADRHWAYFHCTDGSPSQQVRMNVWCRYAGSSAAFLVNGNWANLDGGYSTASCGRAYVDYRYVESR